MRSGAGLSVDVELVSTASGKNVARTVTLQVGCDGIAVRDIGTRRVLRQFPYDEVAAWKHAEGEFHFFAMPQGVDKAIGTGSKSGFQQWTLRTPRGAELTAACKAAMEDLARGQANMATFERTLSTRRDSLRSQGSTPGGRRTLTGMISFRKGSGTSSSSRRGSDESERQLPGLSRLDGVDRSPMTSMSLSSKSSDGSDDVVGEVSLGVGIAPVGPKPMMGRQGTAPVILEGSRESLESSADGSRSSTPRQGDGPINAQI